MKEDTFSYSNPDSHTSLQDGQLHGCRVALQPNIIVKGWPTRAGSRALENFAAIEDATVVERLRQAGAHIAGYTNMAELGFGLNGDTTASAIASSLCDSAIAIDSLGEARLSAAEAGLIGFKPTSGIISRYGLIGLMPSLEAIGVVARNIPILKNVFQVISGSDPKDFTLAEEFPNFNRAVDDVSDAKNAAVIPQSLSGLAADEVKAFEAAVGELEKAGVRIIDAPMENFGLFAVIHQVIGSTEASSSAGKFDSVRYGHRSAKADDWNEMYIRSREESFGPLIKALLFQGAYFQFKDYAAFENACRIRRGLVKEFENALQNSDFIILPTRKKAEIEQADSVSQVYDQFSLTLAANIAGLPAITLPGFVGIGSDDLGLQLIGRRFEDDILLDKAAKLLPNAGDQ